MHIFTIQWYKSIKTFKHKGLKRLYEKDNPSLIGANIRNAVAEILTMLDEAVIIDDLDLPGYRLHPLKGQLKGVWSMSVNGNWRIVFKLKDGHVYDVALVDYH